MDFKDAFVLWRGLGIDYDGSRTTFDSSVNYSLHEYTRDVVAAVHEVCDEEKVAHPVLVSESGRAIAAHHSVLVVEAFGAGDTAYRWVFGVLAAGLVLGSFAYVRARDSFTA
jgi:arginine decarboxylase-like protein